MKRTVVLRADSVAADGGGGAIVPGTSPYPWQSTPSKTVYDIWNAGQVEGQYVFFWDASINLWAVGFEPGPTLARFTRVLIESAFDYANQGPNTWYFPPDNAAGPSAALRLRSRDGASWHTGPSGSFYTVLGPPTDDYRVNLAGGNQEYKVRVLNWELTAHPEGGPFTLDDINNLAVGVSCGLSNGPSGKPWDPAGSAFHRVRVPYLTVTLEIEDLGGDVDGMRFASSRTLRLMRRARDTVNPKVLAERDPGDLMARVYLTHPRGPSVGGGGWGRRRLERRPAIVTQKTYYPESFQVEAELFDVRRYACLGWGVYQIDGPWSTELQGVALLDKGKGFVHTRAQDGWSARPGDGNVMRVLEGYPNVSSEGLAVQGGGDEAIALRNYDLMQSGWSTVSSSGTFSVAADTQQTMVEEQGYLSSARLTFGVGGGTGGRERSLGALPYASGDRLHARVVVHNTEVADPETQFLEVYIVRSGGGLAAPEYWDEANRVFTTTPTYNPIPSSAPKGELVMDAIPCDAAGASSDPTYAIGIGRFSSLAEECVFHGALVDVQHSDDQVAGARTPLITLDATITREADEHNMPHAYGVELWTHERGTAVAVVRPFWRAEDLPADAVKPLLHAAHAANTWQALQFVPKTGSDDLVRFESAIAAEATFQLDCPIEGLDLNRSHVLRAWVRWLGADGWKDYGPYSVEVGYAVFLAETGALVQQGAVLGRLASTTQVPYSRDRLWIGCDGTRFLDGWVRRWETRLNPLHRLEALWKV